MERNVSELEEEDGLLLVPNDSQLLEIVDSGFEWLGFLCGGYLSICSPSILSSIFY